MGSVGNNGVSWLAVGMGVLGTDFLHSPVVASLQFVILFVIFEGLGGSIGQVCEGFGC